MIDDQKNGYLCNRQDSADLLKVLENVLSVPQSELANVRARAQERAELYSPKNIMPKLIRCYESLLES